MKINWNYPTSMWVGENRIKDLSKACINLKISTPLFVTDKDLINLDMTKNIILEIKKNFSTLSVFSNFSGNPIGENVEEGVSEFKKNKCDGVIAFGGGSSLDIGKAIAFMSGQSRPIWDFEDIGDYWKRANEENIAPIIAVPTTAGTGSETGRASAIINKKTGVKKIIFHQKFLPSIVILDPVLTVNLSPRLTAATGMDAFTHCLEAYLVEIFHPMADAIAISGMKLIFENLPLVIQEPDDIDSRGKMLLAATMGGTAFQKGLGMIHSMAHPLSAIYGLHHGLANALLMPSSLAFTIQKSSDNKMKNLSSKLKNITEIISCNTLSNPDDLPYLISSFIKSTGIKLGLGKENISEDDIHKLAQLAFEDSCHATHPFTVTKEDFHNTLLNTL